VLNENKNQCSTKPSQEFNLEFIPWDRQLYQ